MAEHDANSNFGPVRARLASIRTGGTPRFIGSPSFSGAVFLTLVLFALASLATVLFPAPWVESAAVVAWLLGSLATWLMQWRHWRSVRREYLARFAPAVIAPAGIGQLDAGKR